VLDRYPFDAPIKGGFAFWNPELIFITCPRLPSEEFINHDTGAVFEDIVQIERRCNEIRRYDSNLKAWVWIKGMPFHHSE